MTKQKSAFKKSPAPVSKFLGIGEGRAKTAAANAQIAIESAKRETAMAEALAANAGYNAVKEKAAAESNNTIYYIIGGIVLILMVSLYFIIKARRK